MRLIDADTLLVWLVNMLSEFDDGNDYTGIKREIFECVLTKVRKTPIIDAEPVVRCENCESWDNSEDGRYFGGWCFCKKIQISTPPDWYCAYGEARIGGIKTDETD